MNATYRMNAFFAVSKAQEAVKSWEDALKIQVEKNCKEGIEFCERMLKGCKTSLELIKEDVKNVHKWN